MSNEDDFLSFGAGKIEAVLHRYSTTEHLVGATLNAKEPQEHSG